MKRFKMTAWSRLQMLSGEKADVGIIDMFIVFGP